MSYEVVYKCGPWAATAVSADLKVPFYEMCQKFWSMPVVCFWGCAGDYAVHSFEN